MARYVLLFQTNTANDRAADFISWNEHQGMPGMLGIYGFTSAERFVLASEVEGESGYPYQHMDAYDVETDDINSVVQQIKERLATTKSDAVTSAGTLVTVFKPVGPRLRAVKQPVKSS